MAKIKIRPLDDRVVVEPLEAEETTAGGIVLPDTAKEKPQRGIIVAVGYEDSCRPRSFVVFGGPAGPVQRAVGDNTRPVRADTHL